MNFLISNNQTTNFYNTISKLLDGCDSFIFNVAFINYSGLQLLLDGLKKCEQRGVGGKILSSTYLNFTEPKALEKIKEFKNIELKVFDCDKHNLGFHSKAYIFEFKQDYKVLIGSSNITASAFKTNIEWNIKTVNKKDDIFIKEIMKEFQSLWKNSQNVSVEFLESYRSFLEKQNVAKSFTFKEEIRANIMQEKALEKLIFLRQKGEKKALAIAATGSGKTYLSALDIKNFAARKVLFIVHRENILLKAKESFEKLFTNKTLGLFTGNKKEKNKDFVFATIQTLNLSYEQFEKDEFDYIVFDEAHHITSVSYGNVYKYFKPKFLLGLTATANRSDGISIYEYFDNNIACDIRLNDALNHKLITPFHYFGIEDIKTIDYESANNINEIAKLLSVNRRVEYIIEKMNYYSFSGNKRKVLAFCASKEHCFYMEDEFKKKGIESISLTSMDSIASREKYMKKLEDEENPLEVIFTVDIFNEGVDIPSVNMVLFLRPTNSAIVFSQQLGRGLRKSENKEFLTVLDFIGNHNRAFLVSLALLGAKAIDKESLKLSIHNNFANIHNAFIYMDEISKKRILSQLENENFNTLKYLKEQYLNFKEYIKRVPSLSDFISYDHMIDPLIFISNSKSYIEFLSKVEKNEDLKGIVQDELFVRAIRFIDSLLPIKRVYEFVILKYLLENEKIDIRKVETLLSKYLRTVHKDSIKHSFRFLNQEFFDSAQISRMTKLVEFEEDTLLRTKEFNKLLENKKYKEYFANSLNYGLLLYEEKFGIEDYAMPFLKLYEKYNMLNIAQLCNFNKIHSSFRGSGFLKYKDDFFLFINLEKDKFSKASRYENTFLSKELFTYESKPSHKSDSGDGYRLCKNKDEKVRLHIFVRKFVQVDKKTQGFIYLGLANTKEYKDNKPIKLQLQLEVALDDNLYEEFTKIV
jgi:superfamily II DNA or RNA helicase